MTHEVPNLEAHDSAPLRILFEHPEWFRPLFAEFDRRGIPYEALDVRTVTWDPATAPAGSVLFNRMSPSAYLRGGTAAVFATADILARAEVSGARVVNGSRAWATEISKSAQLDLLRRVGVRAPASRAAHDPRSAVTAAEGLRFPVVVKPNVGGSGAGVTRYDSLEQLCDAANTGTLNLGLTGVGLVQELFRATDGAIHRVEVVGGRVLYGIRVHAPEGEFNLCPADACQTSDGVSLARGACAVDAKDQGLRVEAFSPSDEIIDEVERIAAEAGIEVGGIEFVNDERTGERLYYDVNALSNFVADGSKVLGFDPFERLVDWLESEVLPVGTERVEAVR